MSIPEDPMKSGKRELAQRILVAYGAIVGVGIWVAYNQPDTADPMVDLVLGLAPFVSLFLVAAYGMDAYAKQIVPHNRSSRDKRNEDRDADL